MKKLREKSRGRVCFFPSSGKSPLFFLFYFLLFMLYMKQVDINTIFNVFDQDDSQIYKKEGREDLLNEDVVLINAVVRGIENYWRLDELYLNKVPEFYETVREAAKKKVFTKIYNYYSKINLSNLEPFYNTVSDLGYGSVEIAFQEMLDYFVSLEEYEKCASIYKGLNLIKSLYYPEKTF